MKQMIVTNGAGLRGAESTASIFFEISRGFSSCSFFRLMCSPSEECVPASASYPQGYLSVQGGNSNAPNP